MTKEFNIATVSANDDDIRLDRWFKRNKKEIPFTMIAKLIRKGTIKLNGKKAKIDQKISTGDEITYPNLEIEHKPKTRTFSVSKELLQAFESSIFFEDENIIAISKPSGIATQRGTGIKESIDEVSKEFFKDKNIVPKLVHRIDKETSGILLLAKSSNIAAKITELFRANKVDKTYLAITSGNPRPKTGFISDFEIVEKNGRKKKVSSKSQYNVLDYALDKYSLVELKPESGRKHQLRKHCLKIDCPIVGDTKYYNELSQSFRANQLFLHAYKISFEINGKKYDLKSKPHKHFYEMLKKLGLDLQG